MHSLDFTIVASVVLQETGRVICGTGTLTRRGTRVLVHLAGQLGAPVEDEFRALLLL